MIVNAPPEFLLPAFESAGSIPANDCAEPGGEFAELLFIVLALPQMASSPAATASRETASDETPSSTVLESAPTLLPATPCCLPEEPTDGAACADSTFAVAQTAESHAPLALDPMPQSDQPIDIIQLDLGLEEFSEAASSRQSSIIPIGQEAPIESHRAETETATKAVAKGDESRLAVNQPESGDESARDDATAAGALQSSATGGSSIAASAPVLIEPGGANDFARAPREAAQAVSANPFARMATPPVRDGTKPSNEQDSGVKIAAADVAAEPVVERELESHPARNVDGSGGQDAWPARVIHDSRGAAPEKIVEPTGLTFAAGHQDGKHLMAESEWQNQIEPLSREEAARGAIALSRLDDARGKPSGQHEAFLDADGNSQAGSERSPQRNDRVMIGPIVVDVPDGRRDQLARGAEAPAATWRPLVDRLAGDLISLLQVGKQAAVLQLDPPELGKIKIDLRIEDGKLHARIVAEGHESKALLETHLPELRHALLAGQVDVADVRVSQGGWQNDTHDFAQGFQQSPQGRQEAGRGFDPAPANSGLAAEPQGLKPRPQERGRVSMWA